MSKPFQDMSEIECRNKYGYFLWNKASEQIKLNGEEPPLFADAQPVDYTSLLMLFRSNASLYNKLLQFLVFREGTAWLTSESVFSAYINTGEKMQFQYSQIINTLKQFVEDDFSRFDKKDVDKILKEFTELDKVSKKYFDRIELEHISGGEYTIIIDPRGRGGVAHRMLYPILHTNVKIYKQHKEVENLMENYKSRQEVIGRGAIPRKYM